jgi:hypothetical protein
MEYTPIEQQPNYGINVNGEVKNLITNRILRGSDNGKNYTKVQLNNKNYFLHRLLAENYIPNPDNKPKVDHIDGNPQNNRLENLRWISPQENTFNHKMYKNNKLEISGIQKRESGKYRARIRHNGVLIQLGTFENIDDAIRARNDAEIQYFGEFRRV